MKLPLSWILEVIDLNLPSHKIANMLTMAGLEVDGCTPLPLAFENVVVGEVLRTERHPDAEKLCIATVFDGEEQFQVVCGAPNCRPGLKTAFAKIGSVLRDEEGKAFKIKKTKLRGVESYGMLCSEDELGIGDHGSGIMEFADRIQVGADISEIYGDTVLEISLTPNLGHCASVLGVVRELAAMTGKQYRLPAIKIEENEEEAFEAVSVEVACFEKCPRYACRVIKGVKVGPSPDWLQKKLLACDQRPVNNVVDATNYVLMEMGHPLHAFDYDLLEERRIVVRTAQEGEAFVSLDEKRRVLTSDDLLICDGKKPVAIAGVMGGLNSEVHEGTVNILLESAYFEAAGIRRTSKRLALQTEASRRFEREADPNQVLAALDRAAVLIKEISGGEICRGVVDVKQKDFSPKEVKCRLSRVNAVLGTQLGMSEVNDLFTRLEFGVKWDGKDTFTLTIPTYRADINSEVDLIEEVARIYGFDNIPKPSSYFTSSDMPHAPIFVFEREIRRRLMAEGLQELLTCDLIGPKLQEAVNGPIMPPENIVKVLNPVSVEQSILRTSLLPGLLQVAKHNYDHECRNLSGFEIGRIHFKEEGRFKEQSMAGVLLMGNRHPDHWERKKDGADFFDLKGIVESLLLETGVLDYQFRSGNLHFFHPGRQGSLCIGEQEVGILGEIHPTILRRMDLSNKVYYAEIDLHLLYQMRQSRRLMEPMPVYPASDRDLTVTVEENVAIQEILEVISSVKSRLLENVSLIDIYRGEKVGESKKNVTLRFIYRNVKKTVSQEAVDAEHARITSQIEARIRRY
ncbi:phenylalanine--tRNA ligase subunit beta [Waddlia chondrophila]|uniref:Phenylalanine--tRNA ligase beta subunit n=1 Tax=Waddlia chondrophila (strain ATCC VR-1470 / WSU 86-1044) TaxID=716544 RepID=D6YS46_WADCW|nr:phenylalanine--tRNA ligase subunit beta [Waddlia chondrophila]ADI38891.1 Phenylalanyl-tRNA synthetase beta subunit [Waddlia chondrophila WSU 86-1044]